MGDFSSTIKEKERELFISLIVVDTREILRMINVAVSENITSPTEIYVSKQLLNR
jgi:hypothetical protein